MSVSLELIWDSRSIAALRPGNLTKAISRALQKAGSTALRDMRSEASKRIRQRKRLKPSIIRGAFRLRRPRGATIEGMEWAIDVSGKNVPLTAYPHRQTRRGVSVEVNRGKRSIVRGSFMATMKSGHRGIFVRQGPQRLPIRELFGSRPVDALLHQGEAQAVAERGQKSFKETFARVLPLELDKG